MLPGLPNSWGIANLLSGSTVEITLATIVNDIQSSISDKVTGKTCTIQLLFR